MPIAVGSAGSPARGRARGRAPGRAQPCPHTPQPIHGHNGCKRSWLQGSGRGGGGEGGGEWVGGWAGGGVRAWAGGWVGCGKVVVVLVVVAAARKWWWWCRLRGKAGGGSYRCNSHYFHRPLEESQVVGIRTQNKIVHEKDSLFPDPSSEIHVHMNRMRIEPPCFRNP